MKVWIVLGISLLGLTACDDDISSAADADIAPIDADIDAAPSPSCIEAVNHSDLAWIQAEIFDKSCASISVCHQGAASSAGGLTLEEGSALSALSGVASVRFTDWDLVVPGAPETSYLMVILGDVEGPLEDGIGTMPYNNPVLCQPKQDAVRRWIGSLSP